MVHAGTMGLYPFNFFCHWANLLKTGYGILLEFLYHGSADHSRQACSETEGRMDNTCLSIPVFPVEG
jgi:hypothetical protein